MSFSYSWDVVLRNLDGVKITNHEFDTLKEADHCACMTASSNLIVTVWEVRRSKHGTYTAHLIGEGNGHG